MFMNAHLHFVLFWWYWFVVVSYYYTQVHRELGDIHKQQFIKRGRPSPVSRPADDKDSEAGGTYRKLSAFIVLHNG